MRRHALVAFSLVALVLGGALADAPNTLTLGGLAPDGVSLVNAPSCPLLSPDDERLLDHPELFFKPGPTGNVPDGYAWTNVGLNFFAPPPGGSGPPPPPLPPPSSGALCRIPGFTFASDRLLLGGDVIRYRVSSSSGAPTVRFGGRYMLPDCAISYFTEQTTASSGTLTTKYSRPMPDGAVLGLVASLSDVAVADSTVYVEVAVGRTVGGVWIPHSLLLAGYVTEARPLSIDMKPDGGGGPSVGGGGGGGGCCITELVQTDFAITGGSGSEVITVAAGTNVRVVEVNAIYTADGTPGNRYAQLTLSSGGYSTVEIPDANAIAANNVRFCQWQEGGPTVQIAGASITSDRMGIPDRWFSDDIQVGLSADNAEAGDDWGSVELIYEVRQ